MTYEQQQADALDIEHAAQLAAAEAETRTDAHQVDQAVDRLVDALMVLEEAVGASGESAAVHEAIAAARSLAELDWDRPRSIRTTG